MKSPRLILICTPLVVLTGSLHAEPLLTPQDRILGFDTDITNTSVSSFPFNHTAARAVDGSPLTRYENTGGANSGLILTSSAGPVLIGSFTLTTANDRPGNDPASWELYGTEDFITSAQNSTGTMENWTLIASGALSLTDERLTESAAIPVGATTPYTSFRLVFPTLKNAPVAATGLQIGEVKFYENADATGTVLGFAGNTSVAIQLPTAYPSNYPAAEPPSKVIDGLPATPTGATSKYLNFAEFNSGFIVTPASGASVLGSFQIMTGNDTVARDPASYAIYGTNSPITSLDNSTGEGEPWTLIAEGALNLPAGRNTLSEKIFPITSGASYTSYRVIFPRVKDPATTNSMQLSEIQLFTPTDTPILAPGDPILAVAIPGSSSATPNNSGNNETPFNVLDGNPATKYLNLAKLETGFIVTPLSGPSILRSMVLTTANDTVGRDPINYSLYGTNAAIASTNNSNGQGETWDLISQGPLSLPDARLTVAAPVAFPNTASYTSYRLTFPSVKDSVAANSMQIADVQFFTTPDASSPGVLSARDPILAVQLPHSASISPAAEVPARALDQNLTTKYFNGGGANSGFIITPAGGPSIVTGLTLSTGNDLPGRDPVNWSLDGTNSPIFSPNNGTGNLEPWTPITTGTLSLPEERQTAGPEVTFTNTTAYTSYRFTVLSIKDPALPATQYSEVQFNGVFASLQSTFPITGLERNPATGAITLTWDSTLGGPFRIVWSDDLSGWDNTVLDNIPAEGANTTRTFNNPVPAATRLFFRVERD